MCALCTDYFFCLYRARHETACIEYLNGFARRVHQVHTAHWKTTMHQRRAVHLRQLHPILLDVIYFISHFWHWFCVAHHAPSPSSEIYLSFDHFVGFFGLKKRICVFCMDFDWIPGTLATTINDEAIRVRALCIYLSLMTRKNATMCNFCVSSQPGVLSKMTGVNNVT